MNEHTLLEEAPENSEVTNSTSSQNEVNGNGFYEFVDDDRFESEEMDDAEDHIAVSSADYVPGELDAEAPEFGELGAPAAETDREIEAVAGYSTELLDAAQTTESAPVAEELLLDAWHAEYTDPSVVALLQEMKRVNLETEQEVVIGVDDRIQITGTTTYPWRTICSLLITAGDAAGGLAQAG